MWKESFIAFYSKTKLANPSFNTVTDYSNYILSIIVLSVLLLFAFYNNHFLTGRLDSP